MKEKQLLSKIAGSFRNIIYIVYNWSIIARHKLVPKRSEGDKRRTIMSLLSHEYRIKFYSTAYLSPLDYLGHG